MSKYITEDDISLGYSSELDEYDSEHGKELPLMAKPYEIYVGNTGKVDFEKFFTLFKPHGLITDMHLWRTHDHLYHARITYRSKNQSDKAIQVMNNRMVFCKRIRVSYVKDPVELNYPGAIRIDDISADVTEEDIFDHFLSCGDIRFVIKTGYAAYIQFASATAATKALELEMILNGDPYTLSRIWNDDRIDHVQVIENMKDIKYRKPFVMVENYPELPEGTPLCRYKSNFESVGPVMHFKIAPTGNGTVTLALCLNKSEDRDMVIDRFNNAVISDKRLKLYMAPGKACMSALHVSKYANPQNTITVEGIRPYYSDYNVCQVFRRCGPISFLEKNENKWTVCFDNPPAVALASSFHIFSLHNNPLIIKPLKSQTKPTTKEGKPGEAITVSASKKSNKAKPGEPDEFIKQIARQMDEHIKQNLVQIAKTMKNDVPNKQQTIANQAKQIEALFKNQESLMDVKATPVEQPKASTSQGTKRPADNNGTPGTASREHTSSTNDGNEDSSLINLKFLVTLSNLPKGINASDLRDLFRKHAIKSVSLYCSNDLYHPTSTAFIRLNTKGDTKAVILHHHDMYRGKRVCIQHTAGNNWEFLPEHSIMLKNISKSVVEEDIMEELDNLLGLKAVDALKPAHHYAYVDFSEDIMINDAFLAKLRNALTRFKIDVFPLYNKIPKMWMNLRSKDLRQLDKVRAARGATLMEDTRDVDKEFGAHNAHKLFVGNIPRDSQAEDVIDYFNNYGTVVDYDAIEKKSCYLRKSAFVSFVNSKHAQNAYIQQPHYFEGSILDVHLMDCPPMQYPEDTRIKLLTVKFHSPFLTNDEIRYALSKVVGHINQIRFDAFDDRANFVANYKATKRMEAQLESLFEMAFINDEAVKIVNGLDLTPPTEEEAQEKRNISKSRYRQQKEKYLSFVVYKENLKEDMEMRSKPCKEDDVPFLSFYNENSIQINNVSLDATLEDLRDLFVKCGDIVDYRALMLQEDKSKICYIKFNTDLAADLACMYNQRMLKEKRILVHLATETLCAERNRSALVERLNPNTTAEHLHDVFSSIGLVKYVQKQSPFTAIVCFRDPDSSQDAVTVTTIPNSRSFIISPCYEEYDPRFFNKFTCQEEPVSMEYMRATLKPRILPEFHQLELERQVLENLPEDIKSRLINEVFQARKQLPNFNNLPKQKLIDILKKKFQQPVTQNEHFLRLTASEQEKLLEVVRKLPQDYRCDGEILPPAPKMSRNEEPATRNQSKAFAANWYSSSERVEPTSEPHSSNLGPMQTIEPLVPVMHSNQVASARLVNNGPPFRMASQPGSIISHVEEPPFPAMYAQQGPPGMQFFGVHNQHHMMAPRPGPLMGPQMGMMSPMDANTMAGGPLDSRWVQQRRAEMAYNVGTDLQGPMHMGGFNRPPYFN